MDPDLQKLFFWKRNVLSTHLDRSFRVRAVPVSLAVIEQ